MVDSGDDRMGVIKPWIPNPNPAPTPEQRANLKRVADQLFGE